MSNTIIMIFKDKTKVSSESSIQLCCEVDDVLRWTLSNKQPNPKLYNFFIFIPVTRLPVSFSITMNATDTGILLG